ncbi:MAG: polysaccharide deacetylase family protein [Firmicutes bacterium]|nr:polysaccharide deacetylase family protein [Bacillota bacterium]
MWVKVISARSRGARAIYLAILLGLSLLVFQPRSHSTPVPGPVYRVKTTTRAMALTINVVWGTEFVPQMLQDLVSAHVTATFMVGGAWAAAHPQLILEMVRDHMEIGNHGWNHPHPNQLSYDGNLSQIIRTNETVKRIASITPLVFAPPYGEFNHTVLAASAALHMPLIMWTIDTIDWRPSSSPSYMVNKVLARAQPGAIVLMHPTSRTAVALPEIISGLTSRGYRLTTVSNLLTMGEPAGDQ